MGLSTFDVIKHNKRTHKESLLANDKMTRVIMKNKFD